MARIIVTTDPVEKRRLAPGATESPVLLDERVDPVHLRSDHAAEQLIERLAWAINDAEEVERAR
jgi:hypothetical protein